MKNNPEFIPDPESHFYVSLVKSFIRIAAGSFLIMGYISWAGGLFILAELLGIVEEVV
jgi:hypothetical protein